MSPRRWPALLIALLFTGLGELGLSEPLAPFQPNLGELGWPVGMGLTLLAAPLLLRAARRDGAFFGRPPLLAGAVAAAGWLALVWMAGLASSGALWTLHHIPGWLDPGTTEYRLRAGLWYPFHALHLTAPVLLVAALSAARGRRALWALLGGLPWLLAVGLYLLLTTIPVPLYQG